MNTLHFAVIGNNDSIVRTLIRVISGNSGWTAFGCNNKETLYKHIKEIATDIILLSSGIELETENEIKAEAINLCPTIKIIEHYGGGSGLLYNEIQMVFENKLIIK